MAKKAQPEPDPGQKRPARPGPEKEWPDPALPPPHLFLLYFKIFHPFNDFYEPNSDRIIESWTRLGHTNITVNFLPTYLIHLDKWNQLACGQLLWQMNSPQSVRHKAAAVYQSPTEVRFYLKENIYSNIGFTVLKICCIRIKIHRHYNLACNRVR